MRNKLLLLLALISGPMIFAQCDYTLELIDVLGAGWARNPNDAGEVELIVDGNSTTYTIDMPTNTAGTIVPFTIAVNDNDSLVINYTPPALPSDARFRLIDSEGFIVYESPFAANPSNPTVFAGNAVCPTCFAIENLTAANETPDQIELSWDSTGSETQWEVEFGTSPLTPGQGTTRIANTNMSYVLDGLDAETTYDVFVRARCSASDLSSPRGPVTFTTQPTCPRPGGYTPLGTNPNSANFLVGSEGVNFSSDGFIEFGVSPYVLGTNAPVSTASLPFVNLDNLRSNTTYDVFVRFDCGGGDISQYARVPYTFTTPQVCDDITMPAAVNVEFNDAELTWVAGDPNQTQWEVEYGQAPLGAFGSTTITVNSTTLPITGLMSSTDYEFCVTAVCSPLDSSTPVCGSFSTPIDYCGGDLFTDSGGEFGNYDDDEDIIYTICPDNPGDVIQLNFTEFDTESGNNTTCIDRLRIYDGDTDDSSLLIAPPRGTDSWCFNRTTGVGTGDLTLFNIIGTSPSGCITLRFTSDDEDNFAGFTANVVCGPAPTCNGPDSIEFSQVFANGGNMSWNSNGDNLEWEVEVQPLGVAQGTANPVFAQTVNTNRAFISGLMPTTSYSTYVREICQGNDASLWSGPRTLTTNDCDIEQTPYTGTGGTGAGNSFDTFPGECWFEVDNTPVGGILTSASSGSWIIGTNFANDSNSSLGTAAVFPFFANGPVNNDWLVSPNFDLGAPGHGLLLNYKVALTLFNTQNQSNFDADDSISVLLSDDNGLTWSNLRTYNAASNVQPSASNEIIDLAAYSGVVKIAFVGSLGPGPNPNTTADIDFWLDDVRIASTASIKENQGFEVKVYPNPTNDILNLTTVDEIQKVTVFNLMGQKVLQVNKETELVESINMNALNSGIYLVKIETENAEQTLRVVKN